MKNVLVNTKCVWFSDIDCPIRKVISEKEQVNKTIKPAEDSGGLFDMMGNMMKAVPMELTILPAYCNICHLRKERVEPKIG